MAINVAPGDFARPEKSRDLYWITLYDATLADIRPILITTVLMQEQRDRMSIKSCQVFDAASGCPRGNFGGAAAPAGGLGWGYFDKLNTDRPMERSIAFQLSGEVVDVFEGFYRLLRERNDER
ncbi:hypothetical protein [Rhizobium leguminosarum]|uniref:hypothetical protein n=1 Tax=Rhizobium leguminosarum TaxID=384 RepID=UPI000D39ABD9|nr:hypothetical protein [Rhizobium leguminosarum]TCA82262.1 hypothetical protein E0H74_20865 [Rhizobium leguminosarum bv. viciae]TCA92725.1 hypothetical protein E0H76_22215 [Rhizobium leguminosarum bv. viciae]